MIKQRILDFLFNENKYRFTKFLFILLFFIVGFIIGNNLSDFNQVYIVYYVPVLTLVLVISIIRVTWYNKKYNIKTRMIDKVQPLIMVLLIVVFFYFGWSKYLKIRLGQNPPLKYCCYYYGYLCLMNSRKNFAYFGN